ncbi:MAG: ankyrin repeat protein [Chlamydiales bacterium]|jgi:ankyrin repeat protein
MNARQTILIAGALAALVVLPAARASVDDLKWGIHPQISDSQEFLDAVRAGDIELIERLLEARPELMECGDDQGRSALVVAFLNDQDLAGQALVHYGFQPDLVESAMIPDWSRVNLMLDGGLDRLNEYHPVGGTVLYAAARVGRPQLWRLQTRGADANANPLGAEGVTAAFGAVECPDPIDAYVTAVSLFSNGADVNAPQRGGWSVLHAAVDRGHMPLVRYLIRRGAAIDARDDEGKTALDVAVRRKFDGLAELLRNHEGIRRDHQARRGTHDAKGNPITYPDMADIGRVPRERICKSARQSLMKVSGALAKEPRLALVQSLQGDFAVEVAARDGRRDVVETLLDAGAPQSFGTTLMIRDLERAQAMLAEDPLRIYERGSDDTPVMWFCALGGASIEVAKFLLANGVDVDQATLGTTALHWAARNGHIELARFLLDHGADIDAVGYQFSRAGKTPLEVARTQRQWDMTEFLEGR